jgi:hypothetical protein
MPENHHHHHHHGSTVHNHHAAETFVRNNRSIFVQEPKITHHGASSHVSFYVTEGTLETQGMLFLTSIAPNYRQHIIRQASVVAQQNSQPDYPYFAGTVQKSIDVANLASLNAGSLISTVTMTLSDYDTTTGFTNVPKLLYVEIEYHLDTSVHH